ncbi:MAG: DegV family protein [Dehalococcoidia bacterium]
MTDTVSCIPPELAREHQIRIVPASNIMFGGNTYVEGVTISATEAYDLIKKDPDSFMTSAITPGYLAEEFREVSNLSPGIIHITLSSAMSAGFETATIAAENIRQESPGIDIRVVDSKTVSGAQALIVLAVSREAAKGADLDRLVDIAQKARGETGGIMFLDTLRYIYRTGRMSKTASRIASIFNIKPINLVSDEGTVEFVDRVRKRSDGFKKVIELIRKEAETDSLHFMVSHAAAPDVAENFCEQLRKEFNCLSIVTSDYSPVMGYGAGPGAIFVGFQPELDL